MAKNFKQRGDDSDEKRPRRAVSAENGHRAGELCACACDILTFKGYVDTQDKIRCTGCNCLRPDFRRQLDTAC